VRRPPARAPRSTARRRARAAGAAATLFFCIDGDARAAEDVIARTLAPALGKRPPDLLPHCAYGPAERVRERIAEYADAGAQQIHLWPATDPLGQIEALAEAALSRA
jgi:hypothetical protein